METMAKMITEISKRGVLFRVTANILESVYNLLSNKRPVTQEETKAQETVITLCEAITELNKKEYKMALSKKEKKRYITNHGMLCPVCNSKNMESYEHDFEEDIVRAYCRCDECNSCWIDTYILADVELNKE
jgi:formate dehydrogenase maturation protein FdhE